MLKEIISALEKMNETNLEIVLGFVQQLNG
jgi:hypothetical protein